jgi:transcriptional regulator with XRE-family HTH domain
VPYSSPVSAEYRAAAAKVGIRIRHAREAAGYSQDRLALKIGTSRRNVLRWEGGYNVPRADHVKAIAEATGRTADYFLGEDDEEEAALSADLSRVLQDLIGHAVKEALDEREEAKA